MVELVPKMAPEAPDGYVSFVDRHLVALRSESARVAGDAWRAEEIYPEVLTDVAARWPWLELLARRFGRPAAAEDYLHQVLATRAKRWRAEQIYEVEMVVLRAEPTDPQAALARRPVWGDTATGPRRSATTVAAFGGSATIEPLNALPGARTAPQAPFAGDQPVGESAGLARYRRTGPGRSSLGFKQARFLSPLRRPPAPIAEAAIAWWHAYVAYRRRKRVAIVIALILVVAALLNLRATGGI